MGQVGGWRGDLLGWGGNVTEKKFLHSLIISLVPPPFLP